MSWTAIAERQKERSERSSQKGKGGGGDLFMSTKGGGKFTVRFVGEAKEKNILWFPQTGGKKYIVPENYYNKMIALGFPVRKQIISNVIDRDDSKLRLKLLEKGPKVFGPVLTRFNEVLDKKGKQIHPGGANGEDWRIVVDVPSDPRKTDYRVSDLDRVPFTKDELALFRRAKEEDPDKKAEIEKLPIGERGMIDIDAIYSTAKYIEDLDKMIAEKQEELGESEDVPVDTSSMEADTSLDELTGTSEPEPESEENTDSDIENLLF